MNQSCCPRSLGDTQKKQNKAAPMVLVLYILTEVWLMHNASPYARMSLLVSEVPVEDSSVKTTKVAALPFHLKLD